VCLGGWQGLHEGGSAPGLNGQIHENERLGERQWRISILNTLRCRGHNFALLPRSLVGLRPGNDAKIILGPLD
jgi:hypothetical protein